MSNTGIFEPTFDHYTIIVSDLQQSVNFYEDVIGLKQIPNKTQKAHIRWFAIGSHQELHVVEQDPKDIRVNKGVHLCLTLSNMEEFMLHLKDHGVPFENVSGESGVSNTRPDGIKQIYFQDPDGYWIEINDVAAYR